VAAGEPYVVRFRVPEGTTEWDDMVHERIAFPNKDIEDFVILRSDGTPILHRRCVRRHRDRNHRRERGDDHISTRQTDSALSGAGRRCQSSHLPMIHGSTEKN
jgi:glutamyl-tRNA synthetase